METTGTVTEEMLELAKMKDKYKRYFEPMEAFFAENNFQSSDILDVIILVSKRQDFYRIPVEFVEIFETSVVNRGFFKDENKDAFVLIPIISILESIPSYGRVSSKDFANLELFFTFELNGNKYIKIRNSFFTMTLEPIAIIGMKYNEEFKIFVDEDLYYSEKHSKFVEKFESSLIQEISNLSFNVVKDLSEKTGFNYLKRNLLSIEDIIATKKLEEEIINML